MALHPLVFPRRTSRRAALPLLALSLLLLQGAARESDAALPAPKEGAFRLGILLDFSGALGEHGPIGRNAAELAARQINAAGGVLGRPLELYFADGRTDPAASVAAARHLLADDHVHALVGAMGSASTLAIARQVTIPARIPIISPTSTAPEISQLEDDDFVFRATYSDSAQGPVLAQLVKDEGHSSAAVIYRDDPYGRGLYQSVVEHLGPGFATGLAITEEKESYLPELRRLAGKSVLVLLTYPLETEILVREALHAKLFHDFAFADSTRIADLMNRIDPVALEGVKGTSPALRDGPEEPSTRAYLEAYRDAYGVVPTFGPGASVYDSVVCFALAAEKAGSANNTAIRDALRPVCAGPGEEHTAQSLGAALAAVRGGRKINYQGAFSTVDWNAAGDVSNGFVDVWKFSKGKIDSEKLVSFDLSR
jgi:branched-chain amino acid transport system substrate-binding protein